MLPAQIQQANTLAIQAIQALQEANAQLAAQVVEMSPKAEAYDLLTDKREAIDMSIAAQRIADALGIKSLGNVRLYKILRLMGIVSNEGNFAYQKYVESGYFKNCTTVQNGRICVCVKVTAKGLAWLVPRIQEWGEKSEEVKVFIT